MLLASNNKDVDINVGDDIALINDNVDQKGLEPVERSADIEDIFTDEEKDRSQAAAALILQNPAFAGQTLDPYALALQFGASPKFKPPPKNNGDFECRNSCRLQCDYLDGDRKCNFFCGLVC
jgi:hypothetical protein